MLIGLLGLALAGCASGPGGNGVGVGHYVVGPPYEENGVWYYPRVDYHYDRTGIASWYGAAYNGRLTANGEIYDMNGLTAAHPTLPLPSVVEVTDLRNGRTLQLRVNDRGPFIGRRLIDVSRRAAQLIGFEAEGTAPVRIRILPAASIAAAEAAMQSGGGIAVADVPAAAPAPPPAVAAAPAPPLPTPLATPLPTAEVPFSPPMGAAPGRLYIQAGAFALRDNAERVEARIAGFGTVRVTPAAVGGNEWYRVRLGPIANRAAAEELRARVVGSGYPGARVVGD